MVNIINKNHPKSQFINKILKISINIIKIHLTTINLSILIIVSLKLMIINTITNQRI